MQRFFSDNLHRCSARWLFRQARGMVLVALALFGSVGCTSITAPISGIPAHRVPPQFLAAPKNNLVPVDVSRLAQEPPRQYQLDEGDILGIYLEGILPFTKPDELPPLPPVNFPDANSTLPPSLGFPVTVLGNGTITLPLIRPLNVRGLTVEQVQELIRRTYLENKILNEGDGKVVSPIVTLIRERTIDVVVVRQDVAGVSGGGGGGRGGFTRGTDESAKGSLIKLTAGKNDVLNALMESGGLPGVNAKNEVKILRASQLDRNRRDQFVRDFYQRMACNPNPCLCPPPLPEDPAILRIPLRLPPGVVPSFRQEDILLRDGDIVYIESREAEVFYTGGLLNGGEFLLPRDYDLDVFGAMALAGQGVASPNRGGGGGGGFGIQSIGGVPPGMLYVLRKTPCDGQIIIEVDLARALNNPSDRILVQAGDTLILRYKCEEEVLNFGLGSFFTFGIQSIIRR